MTELVAWFERRFAFDFPVALHPNLRARLAGAPARLEELLATVSRERAVARPAPETWSIQEHAGHLGDLEPLWRRRTADLAAGAEVLAEAELTNRTTFEAHHNEREAAVVLAEFRARRSVWVGELDRLTPDEFVCSALHPRLRQPMRLIDLMLFVAEHDDHHLARIRELAAGVAPAV